MVNKICKHFGQCGGCSLQHIEYGIQIKNKAEIIQKALDFHEIKIYESNPYHYRNRMDFIFHNQGLGFRKKGVWHKIIPVDECLIANQKINDLAKEIKEFFKEVDAFHLKKQTGTFKYALIRATRFTNAISFVLNEDSSRLNQAVELIKRFASQSTAENIVITYVPKKSDISYGSEYFSVKGYDELYEEFLGKRLYFSIQGFFQNNSNVAEKMHEHINGILRNYNTKDAALIDLYGGVGSFGIVNSELFNMTYIIESFELAQRFAEKNIEYNKARAKFFNIDAGSIKKLELNGRIFLILDPPRSGISPKALPHIKALNPEAIIFISCNPKIIKKEISYFKEYKIKSLAFFDMFPQTNHSEAVVELIRAIKK